jgi:hypothetical protein
VKVGGDAVAGHSVILTGKSCQVNNKMEKAYKKNLPACGGKRLAKNYQRLGAIALWQSNYFISAGLEIFGTPTRYPIRWACCYNLG